MFFWGNRELIAARKRNAEDTRQALLKKQAAEKGYIESVDSEVVVIEKNNTLKFFVKTAGRILCVGADLLLISLAMIGLTALVYPGPRASLLLILYEALEILRTLI